MSVDYRIEKDRFPVVLVMVGGARIPGSMFVQAHARNRQGREEPPDILNEREAFFPFAGDSGDTFLIAKNQVSEVELRAAMEDASEWHIGARRVDIELALASGEQRHGTLLLEAPTDRPRLLDFLNRLDERFLLLHGKDGVRLINREQIERIRPLE